MFVQIANNQESGSQDIFVLGEKLLRDQEGVYLLPGRLISGLKAEDLPSGFPFGLLDQLPSGIGFYREDSVKVSRTGIKQSLHVQVTTTYVRAEWDGLYCVVSTMDTRRRVLEDAEEYVLEQFLVNEQKCVLAYSFHFPCDKEQDLEAVMEMIAERVRWVEEKGNEQLLFRTFHPKIQ
ncbi:hypothetical protein [Brevibacillus sp. SYSU BS000544]|uniref:hypothetical protein n=1 Tax=Brevibacillus sp. SYSU BS000544 TaxID=3416443 RepID=UPI003CE5B714